MTVVTEVVEPDVVRLRCRSWRGDAVGYEVSAYVVRGVLVDSGFPRVRDEFMRALAPLGVRGALVTHAHEDHAGNVAALADAGIPMIVHPDVESLLREQPPIGAYRRVIWGSAPRLVAPVVPFDPAPLRVLPTPGHTADHQVLWDPERRILASGDLFLGVRVRVAHEHEEPDTLVASLRAAADLEPRLLLDAHRGPMQNAAAMLRAKVAWMEETLGGIRRLAAEGASEREIRRRVLGAEEFVGYVSLGEYSKRSFVRTALSTGS